MTVVVYSMKIHLGQVYESKMLDEKIDILYIM